MRRIDKVAIEDLSYNPCKDFPHLEKIIQNYNFAMTLGVDLKCFVKIIELKRFSPILAPGSTTKTEKDAIKAPSSGGCNSASDLGS